MSFQAKLSPQASIPEESVASEREPLLALLNPWAFLVIVVAVVTGAIFLATQPHPVLNGDAKAYYETAQALLSGQLPAEGGLFNLMRAPVYTGFLAGILLFLQGLDAEAQLQVIRYSQLGLYGLSLWLVYGCARQVAQSHWAGMLALGLAALYCPFLLHTQHLLAETLATTLLLGFWLCWLRGRPWLAAFLLFLSLGTNLFSLWGKVLPLTVLAVLAILQAGNGTSGRQLLKGLGLLLGLCGASFLLLHSFGFSEMLSSLQGEYLLPNFATNDGWAPLVDGAKNLDYRWQRQQPVAPWLPKELTHLFAWAVNNPQLFWERFTVNLYRFFSQPANPYFQSWFGISPKIQVIGHQWLLLLTFVAVPLTWRNPRLLLPYAFALVWAASYALVHIETRYALPVLALLMVAAGTGLHALIRGKLLRPGHLLSIGVPLVSLTLWLDGTLYPIILRAFEGISYTLYGAIGVGILGLWLLGLLIPLARQIKPKARISPEFLSLLLVMLLCVPILTAQALTPAVREWRIDLAGAKKAHVRRLIPLTGEFFRPKNFRTFLVLETDPPLAALKIRVNGIPLKTQAVLPPGLSLQQHLHGGLRSPESLRQYQFIPLEHRIVWLMERHYMADIAITIDPDSPPVKLYGDYPVTPGQSNYWLPNPDWQRYSLYKAIFDGDGRIPGLVSDVLEQTGRQSESIYSYGRTRLGELDLSPEAGLQLGQYRVFLMRLHPDDVQGDYPAPQFRIDSQGNIFKPFRLAY